MTLNNNQSIIQVHSKVVNKDVYTVNLVEHELLTLLKHRSPSPTLCGIRALQNSDLFLCSILWIIACRLSFIFRPLHFDVRRLASFD